MGSFSAYIAGVGASFMIAAAAGAQPAAAPPRPAPPAPLAAKEDAPAKAVGVENYIHTVVDLDKSVAFYRDVVGLKVRQAASEWTSSPALARLTNTPGSKSRSATLELPGTNVGLLLTEYGNVKGRALRPRNCDPGASTLAIGVQDLDKALAAAAAAGATIVTNGGKALAMGPSARLVFVQDPDGFFLELNNQGVQGGPPAPDGKLGTVRAGFTIADIAKAQDFFHGVLGFEYQPASPTFLVSPRIGEMVGVPGLEIKSAFGKIPGTTIQWEFLQFQGVPLQTYRGRLQDPGTPAISFVVTDVAAAAAAIQAAGGEVITAGGKPVVLGKDGKALFVRDPNGIPLQLIQRM